MSNIQAINTSFSILNNPFLLELMQQHLVDQTPTNNKQPLPESAKELLDGDQEQVDTLRLERDSYYLRWILDRALQKARMYFLYGWYEESDHQYNIFFNYQLRYGKKFSGIQDSYFFALFERTWLNDVQGKIETAEKQLNEELMMKLRWAIDHPESLESTKTGIQPLKDLLSKFETQGLLPEITNKMALQKPIDSKVLLNFLNKIVDLGYRDLAKYMLGHIEVRLMLKIFQAESAAQRLFSQYKNAGNVSPWMMPYLMSLKGVPLAPTIPVDENDKKRLHPDELPDLGHVYTDLIAPVYALKKDPNEEEKRREREKKRIAKLKKRSGIKTEAEKNELPDNPFMFSSLEGHPPSIL